MDKLLNSEVIEPEKTEILFSNLKSGVFAHCVISIILAYIQSSVISDTNIIIWLCYSALVLAFRGISYLRYKKTSLKTSQKMRFWRKIFTLGTFLAGTVWGLAGIILFPTDSTFHQFFLVLLIIGMTAGAFVLSVVKIAMLAFFVPALAPVILSFILLTKENNIIIGMLVSLYLLMMCIAMLRYNKVITNSLLLRHQNDELLNSLQIETDRALEATNAKSTFLANMSHEIRTPMNAIIGLTELLKRTNPDSRQENYIKKIDSSSHALLGIINDILDFSKIEAGKLEIELTKFNLCEILDRTSDILTLKAAEKGLKLTIQCDKDVPTFFEGDPLRIEQILINLINNAIKFTEKGEIIVKVELKELTDNLATLHFSVSDTGIGIDESQINKLFESFSQADESTTRRFGGTGLGLSICKNLVELMGGTISIDSTYGEGSTFFFSIDLQVIDEEFLKTTIFKEEPLDESLIKNRKILFVEDHELNREIGEELLVDMGLQVVLAINGIDALNKIETEDFDCIITDIQMPEMSGDQLTIQLRSIDKHKSLPIIALTADVMNDDKEYFLSIGINEIIAKPINIKELTSALIKLLPKNKDLQINSLEKKGKSKTKYTAPTSPLQAEIDLSLIDGVDIEKAIKLLGGNQELVIKTLLTFFDDYQDSAEKLQEYLTNNQITEAANYLHTIKGLIGIFATEDLSQKTTTLHKAFKNDQIEDIEELISDYKEKTDIVLASIKKQVI